MTITSQNYPVTVDSDFLPESLALTPPNPASFTAYKWVVVSNLTPFIANLAGVGDDLVNVPVLQPFSGDKYPYTNVRGAIRVTWSEITAPTADPVQSPYITVQFSDLPDGSDFPGIYPISYTAQAIGAVAINAVFNPGSGVPLDVVTYGGLKVVNYPLADGDGVIIVGSPPSSTDCWRLQTISNDDPSVPYYLKNGAGNIVAYCPPKTCVPLDGQLAQGSVSVALIATATGIAAVTYDKVQLPTIN